MTHALSFHGFSTTSVQCQLWLFATSPVNWKCLRFIAVKWRLKESLSVFPIFFYIGPYLWKCSFDILAVLWYHQWFPACSLSSYKNCLFIEVGRLGVAPSATPNWPVRQIFLSRRHNLALIRPIYVFKKAYILLTPFTSDSTAWMFALPGAKTFFNLEREGLTSA